MTKDHTYEEKWGEVLGDWKGGEGRETWQYVIVFKKELK